jgi:hypothetical protein
MLSVFRSACLQDLLLCHSNGQLIYRPSALSRFQQNFRQLGDIRRDAPGLVAAEQVGRRATARELQYKELLVLSAKDPLQWLLA